MPMYREVTVKDLQKAGITQAMIQRCVEAQYRSFVPPEQTVRITRISEGYKGHWARGGITRDMLHKLEDAGLFEWKTHHREGLVEHQHLVPSYVGYLIGSAARNRSTFYVPVSFLGE